MRIDQTNLLMRAERSYSEKTEEREVLSVWADSQDQEEPGDKVTISEGGRNCRSDGKPNHYDAGKDCKGDLELNLKALLVEVLSGKKVVTLDASVFEGGREHAGDEAGRANEQSDTGDEREGWGLEYSESRFHHEREEVFFVAAGVVRTTDGEEIDFKLRLEMSREFTSYQSLNIRAGDALLVDPLVVNFGGSAAGLTDANFSFDLDTDGVAEALPVLGPGSGFLALDLNDDGIINNGHELFGPQTGNGFEELARLDHDGNEWIDEQDPAYEQLSVWTIDHQGNSSTYSLRDAGIGAIYLGSLSSQFDLTGPGNALQGRVSDTGLFLTEDGRPGTIQQLDFVI